MKKFKFYLLVLLITILVSLLSYFFSDYSNRIKVIHSLLKEEDKNKIIKGIVEKVETESMKLKLQKALITFSQKIENGSYSDEHLENLLKIFEKLSESGKIDSSTVERFYQQVNKEF